MSFFEKVLKHLQRAIGAEPKNRGGRPRKYATVEEQRAADAKHSKDYRDRQRLNREEDERKRAAERTVGQFDAWQDSTGSWHCGIVLTVDREKHATGHHEIALDANGNPRKYRNGAWVWLEDSDDEPLPAPVTPTPVSLPVVQQPVQQSAPVVQFVPVVKPKPGPTPKDNQDNIGAFWASRYGCQDFEPDPLIFLVNGTANLDAASRMGQLAVTIPQWYSNYNAMFVQFTSIWIVANRQTDEVWTRSLLTATPEVRAKMRLCVCTDVPELISLKLAVDDAILRKQPGVTLNSFYGSPERFKSLPQTEEEIKALFAPPPTPPYARPDDLPQWRMGGSAASSASRATGWIPKPPRRDPNSGGTPNDGSNACM
jgi:hypothetical protein